MAHEAARRAHEHARVLRRRLGVLVFRVAVAVVDADADDLLGIGHRGQIVDVVERDTRLARVGEIAHAGQHARAQRVAERFDLRAEQPAEVDDAAVLDDAPARAVLGAKAARCACARLRDQRAAARLREGAAASPARSSTPSSFVASSGVAGTIGRRCSLLSSSPSVHHHVLHRDRVGVVEHGLVDLEQLVVELAARRQIVRATPPRTFPRARSAAGCRPRSSGRTRRSPSSGS